MRNEKKKNTNQQVRAELSIRSNKKSRRSGEAGRISDETGRAAERKIGRTPHDKSSVSGSDYDGQAV